MVCLAAIVFRCRLGVRLFSPLFPIAQYSTPCRPPNCHPSPPNQHQTPRDTAQRSIATAIFSTDTSIPLRHCAPHQSTIPPNCQSTTNLEQGTCVYPYGVQPLSQGISVNLQVSTLWPSTFQPTAASNLITCQRSPVLCPRPSSFLLARLKNNKVCYYYCYGPVCPDPCLA